MAPGQALALACVSKLSIYFLLSSSGGVSNELPFFMYEKTEALPWIFPEFLRPDTDTEADRDCLKTSPYNTNISSHLPCIGLKLSVCLILQHDQNTQSTKGLETWGQDSSLRSIDRPLQHND